ncbi:MAG: tetratricopeptide repeat protein [Candidatus Omnitrophica bacterium]|nr:tetratricopeptide repeat protein [Candidatus Omnitrophota bacterium]
MPGIKRGGIRAFFAAVLVFFIAGSSGYGADQVQEKERLDKAIALYQHQNYEEALVILMQLRDTYPESPAIAYYTGLTYKQMQDFASARPHLEAAATLKPPVNTAIIELVDLLYQMDEVDEAKKWIERAEQEGIAPAQTTFLKGLVLLKEQKDPEKAVRAFDEAVRLDNSLAQTVKYYKAFAYVQLKKLGEAKKVFKEVVLENPSGDLATYANEYMDAISRQEEATKPFRGSATASLQYDDNVVLKPLDDTIESNTSDKGDWRHVYTVQGEYNVKPNDRIGLKMGGSYYYAKEFELGFYDTMSTDISAQPAVYFENAMLAAPMHYNNVRINDKRYLDLVGIGSLNNFMVTKNDMLQASFTHNRKYFTWPPVRDDDNRDSFEYAWSAGWYRFFFKNRDGIVFCRYAMNYEDAKGNNWTYFGNRVTAGTVIPFAKIFKLNVVTDYFHQEYKKINSAYDKERHDDVLTVSSLFAIEIFKDCEVQLQYVFVDDLSSIGVYKYTRNIFSTGIQYKF